MWEKCSEIDEKEAQYRRLAKHILDQPILDRIEEMKSTSGQGATIPSR
jgi:hypothetical protein